LEFNVHFQHKYGYIRDEQVSAVTHHHSHYHLAVTVYTLTTQKQSSIITISAHVVRI